MPANVHPSASDLLAALHQPNQASFLLEHLRECLACRIRMSRIRHALEPGPASTDVLQRIIEASTPLPEVLTSLISGHHEKEPQPNEIWRVGRGEALLVWVRHVFEDSVADVVPLVLDVELADQESVIVGADATPLATETAAIVPLRTHIHTGAFLNKVGILDIRSEVNEVMTAVREGRRPSDVRVGSPVEDDDDQRLEYRQALRDLLGELSPSAWFAIQDEPGTGTEPGGLEPDAVAVDAVTRVARVPEFIAFELDRYSKVTRVDPAVDFHLPPESLVTLSLCRRPRREHYAADLAVIAAESGTEPGAVANLLRATDAVTVLAGRRKGSSATRKETSDLLIAARDHSEEFTELEDSEGQTQALPGWLNRAIDRFWGDADTDSTFPRDLHLPILTNLPLAIIEIDGLSVENLGQWLQRRHLPQLATVADRPLRGCLVAHGGVGLLFVDRSDDPAQRRLTMAHEAAHFIVDYLIPRENVARRRPELLDVLDGEREPTDAERFDALLADVPVGFHAHLLERDTHGGYLTSTTTDVEDRAERLALELLAPLRHVLNEMTTVGESGIEQVLRARFGLPVGVATRYANHLRRDRPTPPRTLLEAIGMTPPGGEDAYSEDARRREAGP